MTSSPPPLTALSHPFQFHRVRGSHPRTLAQVRCELTPRACRHSTREGRGDILQGELVAVSLVSLSDR
jgi:hypothetical protein